MTNTKPSPADFLSGATAPVLAQQAFEYWVDATQRTLLFWDVMRQRSRTYYEQRAKAVPNVLSFEAELVLDARTFERPANYLLVRIKPPAGVLIDPKKRPFVVVDPRAGHGPGIGGFKADSELGVAMRAGHPAYFVGFTPEPMPGQTIEDIMRAEARFLEKVIELHPEADGRPCVVGNCQAGWAVMMLAAVRPELFGPLIIAGSPLSYWAGVEGENPMRYTGGVLGGSWLTALTGDLGNGKFDGGNLVTNFEGLNPANTLWSKQYNLWSKIDTEAERYLEFEKWWGGHVNLNADEMQWIVDQLFVGNRLATAEIRTSDGLRIDLRNIRSPIVCFCSKGDNITPPQQALGWIVDLYQKDDDIKASGQTIIYAIHESVGHLGIFVSGGVARKEHDEFASNVDLIDILPPGLYEAVLTPKAGAAAHGDLVGGEWIVRFEPRTLAALRAIVKPSQENELRFAAARRVSEINLGLYRTFLQPFVRAFASTQFAEQMHQFNPAELPMLLFSDKNPLMKQVAEWAEQVRGSRQPVDKDNPLVAMQAQFSEAMVQALEQFGQMKDRTYEQIFLRIYDSPLLQATLGLRASDEPPRRRPGIEPERLDFIRKRIAEIKERIAEGGALEAGIRSVLYIGMAGPGADERAFNVLRQIRGSQRHLTLPEFKQRLREQYFALLLDREAALAAIPKMLPADTASRAKLLETIRRIVSAVGEPGEERAQRVAQIEKLFGAVSGAGRRSGRAAAPAPARRGRNARKEQRRCPWRSRARCSRAAGRWSSASPTNTRSPTAAPGRSVNSAPISPSPT
jgi:pimeloyl-ACP methyl ester carboxylesterase